MVAVGLLHWSQVGALRVLHEHDLAFAARVHLLDDRGHGRESRLSGRGEPAVADHDTVLFVSADVRLAGRRDQQRLFDALASDARRQFFHVADLLAWIMRVGMQVVHLQILYGDTHDSSLEFRFGFRLAEITERRR